MSDPLADVEIVRHPRARTMRLAMDPATGRLRLTLPRRGSIERARAWAAGQGAWIAQQRARLPEARPFVPDTVIPFDDEMLTLVASDAAGRTARREGNRLIVPGSADRFAAGVERWLRREALTLLSADTAFYAVRAGVAVSRVAVGDARGRWGSCSGTGTIRYNWRLALAPAEVRRATAAHEVAHRVHMNHSPAFHALVATLFGRAPDAERAWLRRHGAALHWFGRISDVVVTVDARG